MAVPRYWRQLGTRYKLIGTHCGHCGAYQYPPRAMCPACHRHSVGKMEPHRFSGRGKVLSYTVVHTAQEGYEAQVPYAMAIIELEEGPRLTAQVVDCNPDEVYEGQPVRSCFRKIGEDSDSGIIYYGAKFAPVKGTWEDQDQEK